MTWAAVSPVLVSLIEGATPSETSNGLRASFRYVPEASEDSPPRTRDFTYSVTGGATLGGLTRAGLRRNIADVTVMVFYDDRRNAAALRDAMVGDFEAVRDRLLDHTLWQSDSTGIQRIALGDEALALSYSVETVEGGAVLLIEFPVDYRD